MSEEEEEEEEGNFITEKMIKMATFLIHELARRRGAEFKDIQVKCKESFGYSNLAKVSLEDGHLLIDRLTELTGGEVEEEQEAEGERDDLSPSWSMPVEEEIAKPEEEKEDPVVTTMRESVRAAVEITIKEVVEKDVPVQGLGGFVLEITKVLFTSKMDAREKEATEK